MIRNVGTQRCNWLISTTTIVVLCLLAISSSLVQGKKEKIEHRHKLVRKLQPMGGRDIGEADSNTFRARDISRPQRIRINSFDMMLSPTNVQLTRADEDLLLLHIQDILTLYIETQLPPGRERSLEYALFSDVQKNTWMRSSSASGAIIKPAHSILRLNGGVVSFMGSVAPSEEEVNQWVKEVVDSKLVPSFQQTQYAYIEQTKYETVGSLSGMFGQPVAGNGDSAGMGNNQEDEATLDEGVDQNENTEEDPSENSPSNESIVINVDIEDENKNPNESQDEEEYSYLVQTEPAVVPMKSDGTKQQFQAAAATADNSSTVSGSRRTLTKLLFALGGIAAACAIAGMFLATMYQSRKSENSPKIQDSPEVSMEVSASGALVLAEEGDTSLDGTIDDTAIAPATSLCGTENQSSSASTLCPPHEDSLSSSNCDTSASQSEWTLSSGLSASVRKSSISSISTLSNKLNPWNFKPPMIQTESFQRERAINLQKDMLYSSWAGVAPSIGRCTGRGESVLKPSHFTAAQALEQQQQKQQMSSIKRLPDVDSTLGGDNKSNASSQLSENSSSIGCFEEGSVEIDTDSSPFVFEQAHEREEGREIYLVPTQSRRTQQHRKSHGSRRDDSNNRNRGVV